MSMQQKDFFYLSAETQVSIAESADFKGSFTLDATYTHPPGFKSTMVPIL